MNTCDTCKWWDIEVRQSWPITKNRECLNPKLDAKSDETEDVLAQGYDAVNKPETGPKFGCVHHEPK